MSSVITRPGPNCPACNGPGPWRSTGYTVWECASCGSEARFVGSSLEGEVREVAIPYAKFSSMEGSADDIAVRKSEQVERGNKTWADANREVCEMFRPKKGDD